MKKNKKSPRTMKKVLKYIGKYKLLLPFTLLFALITVALTLYLPLIIGEAINLIVGKGAVEFEALSVLLFKAIIIIAITALSQWLMSTVNNKIAYGVARDVRRDAFLRIERLPLSYLDTKPKGDLISRIINDTEQFSEGLLLGFTQLFTGILTILGTLVLLLIINWKIAIAVVLLTPISLFVAKFIASKTYNMFKEQSKTKGETTALIDEMIGNQKLVKALSLEERAVERFNEVNERLGKYSLKAIFYSSITNPATRFINNIVYAVVALIGALAVISAEDGAAAAFTVGELTTLLSYATQYAKPFNEISGVVTEFQNSLASAERVFELIEEKTEEADKEGAVDIAEADGYVSAENVYFSYTADKPLIEKLNIDVKPGQMVAIVGPTGSGKTTLINLLMRFYDVNSGDIKVDGKSISDITKKSLRRNFGMVLQDTWLHSGTIKDNIRIGKPDATDEEVIRAAKATHAHGFIKRLSHGYDTVIGEDDGNLSQGQRQLISIARVMLMLPPMLILDEATSSIDTRTEMKIQDAFREMMQGRTSFIVAHRLSTVRRADLILVMRDGNIIEKGTHEQLLSMRGFYYELYNSQFAH